MGCCGWVVHARTIQAAADVELGWVKSQRQLATFAASEYKQRFRAPPEFQAQDVLAQALWCVHCLCFVSSIDTCATPLLVN